MPSFDLRSSTFDEFVEFLFNREVPDGPEDPPTWYHEIDLRVDYDPVRHAEFYTRLFSSGFISIYVCETNPTFLLEKYTRAQLEQAFWAIHGCLLDGAVSEIM